MERTARNGRHAAVFRNTDNESGDLIACAGIAAGANVAAGGVPDDCSSSQTSPIIFRSPRSLSAAAVSVACRIQVQHFSLRRSVGTRFSADAPSCSCLSSDSEATVSSSSLREPCGVSGVNGSSAGITDELDAKTGSRRENSWVLISVGLFKAWLTLGHNVRILLDSLEITGRRE